MPAVLEIEKLSRSFGHVHAVQDVSFSFDRGQVYGFIGPNGAGKTTTMRILATLELPDQGDARVAGYSVIDDADKVRHLVGFMPDAYGTYPNVTVQDYLEFFGRSYGLRGQKLRETVESVITFTGMSEIRQQWSAALSKGLKQRLALGRVLLHNPELLILDEPAAGLDPRARVEFRELVRLLADQGKSILISSHILTELSEMVHGCVIIERGRVLCQGRVDEVRARVNHGARFRVIHFDLVRESETIERFFSEQPHVENVRLAGRTVSVDFTGTEEASAHLLKMLVNAEYPIIGMRSDQADLEDVFMAITRGEVQ